MRVVSGTDLNEESGPGQAMHSVGIVRTSVLKFTEIGAFEGKIRMSVNLRRRGLFWAKRS